MGQFDVLELLKKNKHKYFNTKQIMGSVGIGQASANRILRKLYKFGLIDFVVIDGVNFYRYKDNKL